MYSYPLFFFETWRQLREQEDKNRRKAREERRAKKKEAKGKDHASQRQVAELKAKRYNESGELLTGQSTQPKTAAPAPPPAGANKPMPTSRPPPPPSGAQPSTQ